LLQSFNGEGLPISSSPNVTILTSRAITKLQPAIHIGMITSLYISLSTIPTISESDTRGRVIKVLLPHAYILIKDGNITKVKQLINLDGIGIVLVEYLSVILGIAVIVAVFSCVGLGLHSKSTRIPHRSQGVPDPSVGSLPGIQRQLARQ
jgi:hypothetical protein